MKATFTSGKRKKSNYKLSNIKLNCEDDELIIISSLSNLKKKQNLEKFNNLSSHDFTEKVGGFGDCHLFNSKSKRAFVSTIRLLLDSFIFIYIGIFFLSFVGFLFSARSFFFDVHRIVAIVTQPSGVIKVMLMRTFGGHLISPIDMVAIVAHASSIVLGIHVFAVGHLPSLSTSFALRLWLKKKEFLLLSDLVILLFGFDSRTFLCLIKCFQGNIL